MRKHFLLFLLTLLLPLAGWADEITVNLVNLQYEYGAALPDDGVVTTDMFSIQGGETALPTGVTKAQVAEALQINILDGPMEGVGNYHYSLTTRAGYNGAGMPLAGHSIFLFGGGNDGLLKIVSKPITITADNKSKTYGEANPEFTAAITAGELVGEEELTWTVARTSANENAGTYDDDLVVTITSEAVAANYDITLVKGQFTINQKEIAAADLNIELGTTSFVYDGTAKKPTVTVKDGTTPLATTDYTVSYFNNTNVVDNSAVTAENQTQLWVAKKDGGNYTFTAKKATFAITKAPLTVAIKAGQKKEYGEGDPTLEYEYTGFVNGETKATAAHLVVPALSRVAGENAGIYAITAAATPVPSADNYEITFNNASVNFSITAKALNDEDFTYTAPAGQTYTGSALTPALGAAPQFNGVNMTANTDYTLSYSNNTNVGTATVTINGKGNFKGTKDLTFAIGQAGIFIIPTAAEKTYGAADPTKFEYTLKFGEATVDNSNLHGTVVLDRVAGENVGTYKIYVKSYTPNGENPDNYTVSNMLDNVNSDDATNKTALFTIKAPTTPLVLKFKTLDAAKKTKVYGEPNPGWNIDDLTVESGLAGSDTWDGIKTSLGDPTFKLSSDNVGTVSVNVTGLVSSAYPTVTVQPMTDFEITARPITVTLKNQTINYGAALDQTNPTGWEITTGTLAAGDEAGALGILVKTVNAQNTYAVAATAYEDAITAEITNDVHKQNYALTTVKGDLTVNATEEIAMRSVYADDDDDEFTTIKAFDGEVVKVKITVNRTQELKSGKKYTWKGEEWNAFILPFDITPKELSEKFGYAIVNVVNPAATSGNNVAFKLQMSGTIKANTPFMLKNYQAVAPNTVIDFGTRKIVAPANAEVSVDANTTGDIKFIGSYNTKTIDKTNSNLYYYNGEGAWKHLGASSDNTWNIAPFNAYIETPATAGAREITFTFEELDGSATAITSVSEESTDTVLEGWYTINGIKLESAPTQKGIYIKDGKKVVIK